MFVMDIKGTMKCQRKASGTNWLSHSLLSNYLLWIDLTNTHLEIDKTFISPDDLINFLRELSFALRKYIW